MTTRIIFREYSPQPLVDTDQSASWFQQRLKLKSGESLDKYFITKESHEKWDHIKDKISVQIKRIVHWIPTGIWIDPSKVGRLINEYRYLHEHGEDTEAKIRELCNRILGEGFYDKSLQEAMDESAVESISNGIRFFGQFIKSPITVGAILPSSKYLSKKITKDLRSTQNATDTIARRILEVGPGTGIFTREIVRNLKANDQLDLVEYEAKFCDILRNRFGHLPNVRIHHVSIIDFKPTHDKYDYIISGLPLNAFEVKKVERIYDTFKLLIKEGGTLSYFEYIGLPKIKKLFVTDEEKENIKNVLEIKKKFFKENQGTAERVWLNAPPARVCRCIIYPSK